MRRFVDDGLVEEDGLEFLSGAHGQYVFDGHVILRDGRLKVTVAKVLESTDDGDSANPMVQTIAYSYNVSIIGHGNVFRYCSPHDENDDTIDHHKQHHRHQYDPFGPDRFKNQVTLIEDGNWPTLGQVVQEADQWYLANLEQVARLGRAFEE